MKPSFIKIMVAPAIVFASRWPVAAQKQKPVYLVYAVSGMVRCQPAGTGTPRPLAKNAALYSGDRLLLNDTGNRVILVAENGEYIRLSQTGNYGTEAIQQMQQSRWKETVSVRYITLLWEEFFKPRPVTGHLNPETIAGSTGGVTRGGLQLLFPASVFRTSMDKQWFRWTSMSEASGYLFVVTDENNSVVFSRSLSDTSLLLPLQGSLQHGSRYSWSLEYISVNGSNRNAVSGQLEWIDEAAVKPTLDLTLNDAVPGVVVGLQQATMLETAGCTRAALESYTSMLRTNPADRALKQMRDQFLYRNGMLR